MLFFFRTLFVDLFTYLINGFNEDSVYNVTFTDGDCTVSRVLWIRPVKSSFCHFFISYETRFNLYKSNVTEEITITVSLLFLFNYLFPENWRIQRRSLRSFRSLALHRQLFRIPFWWQSCWWIHYELLWETSIDLQQWHIFCKCISNGQSGYCILPSKLIVYFI